MAVTRAFIPGTLASAQLVVDADCDATAENDVFGGAITLYLIEIDNAANGAASFVKLYDAAAPTVGTTAPDYIFKVEASVKRSFVFPDGLAFATGLSIAGLTAGGTAGTTSPTSNVGVKLVGS